jgi:alpha-glucosidase (family GH31 glycosyl hydrolase)
MQLGALTYGFFRNHNSIGEPEQAPFVFGEPYTSVIRAAENLRYSLIPYIYTQFHNQHATGGVQVTRPMLMVFPEQAVALASVDTQVIFGDALLVAPVLQQGATSSPVWLPDATNVPSYDWYVGAAAAAPSGGGWVNLDVTLASLPVFVLGGHIVATQTPELATDLMVGNPYNLTVALPASQNQPAPGTTWGQLFLDDGITPNTYESGNYSFVNFTASGAQGATSGSLTAAVGPRVFQPPASEVISFVRILGVGVPSSNAMCSFLVNGAPATSVSLDHANAVLTASLGSNIAPRITQPFTATWSTTGGSVAC